ncbi:hypothetical protein J6590_092973 [Homalodisca vitripennis]|nr:hypothetical protein J6590_092973 [Homalodisca vitripennis]
MHQPDEEEILRLLGDEIGASDDSEEDNVQGSDHNSLSEERWNCVENDTGSKLEGQKKTV